MSTPQPPPPQTPLGRLRLRLRADHLRWRIPFAGFLLGLMGGFSYAWGVMVVPKMEEFGWSKAEATLPFTVHMLMLALVMVPAGRLQDRLGPRLVASLGAALYLVAYGLAALVGYFPHAGWLVFSYGLVGGMACGLVYSCIAPPACKWFPDQPGLAVSTAVMGFGLAALVLAPVKSEHLLPVHGIEGTFLIMGVITLVVCLAAAHILKNPPEGWRPHGWTPPAIDHGHPPPRAYTPDEIYKTAKFWMTWLTMALVISGGLMSIGLIPAFAKSVNLTPMESAVAIAIFSTFNGLGRPVAGLLADRHGIIRVMVATYSVQALVLLAFPAVATTLPTLYLASALLGWGFAVTLGLFPVLTAACFGVKYLGGNYGLVFTAFGAGAIAPFLGSWLFELTGSYAPAFVTAGALAGLGVLLCLTMRQRYRLA